MYRVIIDKNVIVNCATLEDANDLYARHFLTATTLEIRDEYNKILTKKL